MGVITAYVWGIPENAGIWLAAAIVWIYTVSGTSTLAPSVVAWSTRRSLILIRRLIV